MREIAPSTNWPKGLQAAPSPGARRCTSWAQPSSVARWPPSPGWPWRPPSPVAVEEAAVRVPAPNTVRVSSARILQQSSNASVKAPPGQDRASPVRLLRAAGRTSKNPPALLRGRATIVRPASASARAPRRWWTGRASIVQPAPPARAAEERSTPTPVSARARAEQSVPADTSATPSMRGTAFVRGGHESAVAGASRPAAPRGSS
jgi:hypothetical protein